MNLTIISILLTTTLQTFSASLSGLNTEMREGDGICQNEDHPLENSSPKNQENLERNIYMKFEHLRNIQNRDKEVIEDLSKQAKEVFGKKKSSN